MNTDTATLYKLMVLYMLDKVDFPLSNSQIADFMLEYTNYFTLQETFNSLAEDSFIETLSNRNNTQYLLTDSGKETISLLKANVPGAIRHDIDAYLKKNRYALKCTSQTKADFRKSANGDYVVHCQVQEGKACLIELKLSVPLETQADAMCAHWRNASQDIYDFIMHRLMQEQDRDSAAGTELSHARNTDAESGGQD